MSSLLPLDTWRSLMGMHPLHFYQLADNDKAKVTSACNDLVRQYAWQDADAVGRDEIIQAIATAEDRLREYLGYSIAPRYISEVLPWPRLFDALRLRTGAWGGDGRWLSVQLSEGYVQAVGVESLTLLGNVLVTPSDVDGDGYNDTFTISIATTITDTSQIAVYFAAADRFDGSGASERWRIQPVTVSISAGTATIKGAYRLLVKPIKYEGLGLGTLSPATATNFVTTLDIYQRTTNGNGTAATNSQAVITWETDPAAGYLCCGSTNISSAYGGSPFDPAAVAQAVARVGIRDAIHGIVTPAEATYNTTTGIWSSLDWSVCAEPDRVTVRYLAGLPLDSDGQMQASWRPIVARLAAAELGRPICGCSEANREIYRWQTDLARTSGAADEAYGAVSAADLDNPFGTRRGSVYAWRAVRNLRQLRGHLP
jgi:hypothetical protein